MGMEGRVWMLCTGLRLLNALLVRTYFNPDEHWQALEVAHRITFGYGHLTWEWSKGLRSYLHPLLFAALYKLLAVLNLDTPWLMVRSPRLLQALFAAVGDVYLWKLSRHLFDDQVAKWTLFCQLCNWFTWFCMVRTLSSSLETVLTIISLYYWYTPTIKRHLGVLTNRQLALLFAWISCAIRPTSAVIWIYVGIHQLLKCRDKAQFIFKEVLPTGFFVMSITCVVDRIMYGEWIFVPLNFFKFNFLSGGGDFYGTHSWHWYFSLAFPTMAFTMLPLILLGLIRSHSRHWFLAFLIAWILLVYSFLGHKEPRFILPALPVAMIWAGYSLADYENNISKGIFRWGVAGLFFSNLLLGGYFSLRHQRGSEQVMEYLAYEAAEGRVKSIVFLTQCHATPFYSSLHANLPMRFLDCSPSGKEGYKDEASRFMEDPITALSIMYKNESLHSHVVIFDSLEQKVRPFLQSHSYKLVEEFFQSDIPVDRELQRKVLLYSNI